MKVRRCICVKNKVDLNLKTTSYLGAFRLFIAEKHILRKIPIRIAIGIIPFGHEKVRSTYRFQFAPLLISESHEKTNGLS